MYYQGSSSPIQATEDLRTPYPNIVFLNSGDSQAPPPAQQFVGNDQYQTTIPSFDYYMWRDHVGNTTPKCLSLSLSSHQTGSNQDFLDQYSGSLVLPRISSGGRIIDSKYLKAAQQILDEVANIGEGVKADRLVRSKDKAKIIKAIPINGGKDGRAEPDTARSREIQMKKAQLLVMLDEVEQRYMNHQRQMQMIVASFEQTAGIGSSRRYTQLASRTISKQFRCLRDAISSQINALKTSLREGENEEDISIVNRFRQLSGWRGQRGLPERAVSVLRTWLFEHFLHPYPKDLDKKMMAKQTGLTRSQVSNWFINARVRLWKPMVEEMYLEEMKNQQQTHCPNEEITTRSRRTNKELRQQAKVTAPNQQENSYTTPYDNMNQLNAAFQSKKHNLILNQASNPPPTESNPSQIDPKKPRKEKADIETTADISRGSTHAYLSRQGVRFSTELNVRGLHGNSVSLTLALPPSASSHWSQGSISQDDRHNLPSNSNFEFRERILETGNHVQDSSIGYEVLDFHNTNPFTAPLLPDIIR